MKFQNRGTFLFRFLVWVVFFFSLGLLKCTSKDKTESQSMVKVVEQMSTHTFGKHDLFSRPLAETYEFPIPDPTWSRGA